MISLHDLENDATVAKKIKSSYSCGSGNLRQPRFSTKKFGLSTRILDLALLDVFAAETS